MSKLETHNVRSFEAQFDANAPLAQSALRDDSLQRTNLRERMQNSTREHLPPVHILEPGRTVKESVLLDGKERQYFLHLPKDYDPAKSYPLIMVFNGYGNEKGQGGVAAGAEGMEPITGLSERADEQNFIVAYMDGSPRSGHSWNNGNWFFSKEDDIKFTRGTMDAISAAANVDQSRIYLTGYSEGGSFAHQAGIALADRVAAVATIGSWLNGHEKKPDEPISVMEIHGGKDPVVPYKGGHFWLTMKSSDYLRNFYLKADGITEGPVVTQLATTDGASAFEESWKNQGTGAEFDRITLPEATMHKYFGGYGSPINSINTTDQFLAFFSRHGRDIAAPEAVVKQE